ncbi:MAG: hypothetical protein PHX79_07450 [Sphaerochaetaceae bacterium]|nr:hypothetical protein [Sphaerochaetaceae bacterium]
MIQTLCQILKTKNIKIIYADLHSKNPQLEAYTVPQKQQIIMDKSLPCRPCQHKCVLAEEVGHVLYPPLVSTTQYHIAEYWDLDFHQRGNISYRNSKSERAALLWATSFIIPDDEFWEFAQEGPWERWEWLERFDVEDWFMRRKVGIMRTKKRFKWREIVKRTVSGVRW